MNGHTHLNNIYLVVVVQLDCPVLRYLRTFRGPSCLHRPLSLESCYICYSCDSCDICNERILLARKILVTFAIFAIFADISGPFLPSSYPKS